MKERVFDPGINPPVIDPEIGVEKYEFGQFSHRQRQWLKRRDRDEETGLVRCQFQGVTANGDWKQCPHNEKNFRGTSNFHAHHIIPAGWYQYHLEGLSDINGEKTENFPENGIILCSMHHVGHPKAIHPDYHEARRNYSRNKDGFKEVAQDHHRLTELGIPYWNERYDQILYEIAVERTERYLRQNPHDPWPPEIRRK